MTTRQTLTKDEKSILLRIARWSISEAVRKAKITPLILKNLSLNLQQDGASFVTLTKHGELRGCIGSLQAYQALALDVQEHAIASALHDYRFPKVIPAELQDITIEISRLTPPIERQYEQPRELLELLQPGVDGVILQDGAKQATFLPQVWEKLPEPEDFLAHLCQKMGAKSDLWQRRLIKVSTYQVEEFSEQKV
jgi:AmmeMemoRadiSam system protein A